MTTSIRLPLRCTLEQTQRLRALQQAFAEVCNALAPVVRESRCWNRVALHHMTYRGLRERFPQMGSQMICNAIYSVSRVCRLVYQSRGSPFNLARWGDKPLPLIRFAPTAPVYFDRHTLSLKGGRLSMFTLDGRMRFELDLSDRDERRFHEGKLLEISLASQQEQFVLTFVFGDVGPGAPAGAASKLPTDEMPEYVVVLPEVPGQSLPAGAARAPVNHQGVAA